MTPIDVKHMLLTLLSQFVESHQESVADTVFHAFRSVLINNSS